MSSLANSIPRAAWLALIWTSAAGAGWIGSPRDLPPWFHTNQDHSLKYACPPSTEHTNQDGLAPGGWHDDGRLPAPIDGLPTGADPLEELPTVTEMLGEIGLADAPPPPVTGDVRADEPPGLMLPTPRPVPGAPILGLIAMALFSPRSRRR